MKKSLFVISDLHLGGGAGFQMCSPAGRKRLAEFIRYVAAQCRDGHAIHLVLNGDIVDFLAEKEFASFTNDDNTARDKLASIIRSTKEVWDSLREFAATGAYLTLMLGNHDIELSLPGPRKLLLDTISGDRVEFIYDNQAFVEGPVLIEHGNRHDRWNIVSHDALRAIRSAMSRREKPIDYLGPPGSQLVKGVMNRIKEKYPFVDLLKPENAVMLPILAVLEPSEIKNAQKLFTLASKMAEVKLDVDGIPLDRQYIAATVTSSTADNEMLELAKRLAGLGQTGNMASTSENPGLLERLARAVTDTAKQTARMAQAGLLLQALRAAARVNRDTFEVNKEEVDYINPAKKAVTLGGFRVVIYGHTHLVKRVLLTADGGLYLNTGTWADLMKVPEEIFGMDDASACVKLVTFLKDLEDGNLDSWRCQVPTFARVDFENSEFRSADVYFFDENAVITIVPPGRIKRLDYVG